MQSNNIHACIVPCRGTITANDMVCVCVCVSVCVPLAFFNSAVCPVWSYAETPVVQFWRPIKTLQSPRLTDTSTSRIVLGRAK